VVQALQMEFDELLQATMDSPAAALPQELPGVIAAIAAKYGCSSTCGDASSL
jgi:hypothetical protein